MFVNVRMQARLVIMCFDYGVVLFDVGFYECHGHSCDFHHDQQMDNHQQHRSSAHLFVHYSCVPGISS